MLVMMIKMMMIQNIYHTVKAEIAILVYCTERNVKEEQKVSKKELKNKLLAQKESSLSSSR